MSSLPVRGTACDVLGGAVVCGFPWDAAQEKLQLEKFVDVRGEDFKAYTIDRLETLALDEQLGRYTW